MTEEIISLRPHHIDRFVSYYHKFRNMFDNPHNLKEMYGDEMVERLNSFFDFIASGGTGKEYILVRSCPDSICNMCQEIGIKKRDISCLEPDSLSIWNGSGQVMDDLDLKEGWLYPINEFMGRVKRLYPDRNPSRD